MRLPRRLVAPPPGWTADADVVIVGSGIAGLTTALHIARHSSLRVMLVTKDVLAAGSTRWAQGGIAAALAPGDTPGEHLDDTLVAGTGVCDEAAVRLLVTEGPDAVAELIEQQFQAYNSARLNEAARLYAEEMLAPEKDVTIGLTMAGALTPAGLGGCVITLMENGFVDFIISTGANLYHDMHHALAMSLHRGDFRLDDTKLQEEGVIRIYDILFEDKVLDESASPREFRLPGRRPGLLRRA